LLRILFKTLRWTLILGVLSLTFLLLTAPFQTYSQFNAEEAIAELEFDKLSEQSYLAHLSTGNLCVVHDYPIQGDQWQLDAQFIKWNGPAVMLGFKSRYQLDRLSGRYSDIDQQNKTNSSATDLTPELFLTLFPSDKEDNSKGFFIDTLYGSSVYMNIDETKRYRIYKTEDALIVRSEERAISTTNDGVLTISITKACKSNPSLLNRFSKQINRWLLTLFKK
jgi:hypothetical protein